MVKTLERNSLTLYDRLYFCVRLVSMHFSSGNFFIMRCKRNAHATVGKILVSKRNIMSGKVQGRIGYFLKVKNKKTGEWIVFATNLPKKFLSRLMISRLYRLRWKVETSLRELTSTLKLQQWHSKSFNGIIQELYALMWLVNFTKIKMHISSKHVLDPQERSYKKQNFKLIFSKIAENLCQFWKTLHRLIPLVTLLVRVSTEKRKRYSRSYPRELKTPASPYPYCNTLWFWEG